MDKIYRPEAKLDDYKVFLIKKILRLKSSLDKSYDKGDHDIIIETLQQLEADLFKLKNVGTLMDMRKAA
jgi:hypothetical protein